MADLILYLSQLKQFEGGFSDVPGDAGGATMWGVTLKTFQQFYGSDKTAEDLKRITNEQYLHICKAGYWDSICGDEINDQQVANCIFDFAFNSGIVEAVKKTQQCLPGCAVDGIMGPDTLKCINGSDAPTLCNAICDERITYFEAIVFHNPSQQKFLDGWRNRANSLRYKMTA